MSDITIPPEALEAAAMEMAPHPWSMYTDAAKEHFRGKARAACLAMLKAWPDSILMPAELILPLTENSDE